MNTVDEAESFIAQVEKMLADLDTPEGDGLFVMLTSNFGEVSNFESFKVFYSNFLLKCPNQQIVEGHNNDADAQNLWNSIDSNHNGSLDITYEGKLLVKVIINFALTLTRNFFHI